jgi:hypothetical protein
MGPNDSRTHHMGPAIGRRSHRPSVALFALRHRVFDPRQGSSSELSELVGSPS